MLAPSTMTIFLQQMTPEQRTEFGRRAAELTALYVSRLLDSFDLWKATCIPAGYDGRGVRLGSESLSSVVGRRAKSGNLGRRRFGNFEKTGNLVFSINPKNIQITELFVWQ